MREPADVDAPTDPAPKLKLVREAKGSFDFLGFIREQWRPIVSIGTLALGISFVLLGWYGAAHTDIVAVQIPFLISGGLLGLGLIIFSGLMAYSFMNAKLNEDFRRQIIDALGGRASTSVASAPGAQPTGGTVHVVPGGKGYHLAGCPIIEGKQGVREMRLIQAVDGGYASCKLCSPD
jgi:hypothetical protein